MAVSRYLPQIGERQEVYVHQHLETRQAVDVYVAVGYVTRQAYAICKTAINLSSQEACKHIGTHNIRLGRDLAIFTV